MAAVRDACDHVVSFAASSPSQAMARHGDRALPLRCEAMPRHCWPVAFCQSRDFPPTTTQPNAGSIEYVSTQWLGNQLSLPIEYVSTVDKSVLQ